MAPFDHPRHLKSRVPPWAKYNVTVEVEKLENRLRYLLSDNPAGAGRFLREEYKPKSHDDSSIRPSKREANRTLDKLHAITGIT